MPETLSNRADLTEYPKLRERVKMAIVGAAIDVSAEPADAPNHDARISLANQVLRNPGPWADVYVHGVLMNANVGIGGDQDPTTDSEAADGTLRYVVNSLWDAYSLAQP